MDASISLANPKGTSVLSIEYPDRPNVLAGVDGNGPIHTVALETVWGLPNPTNGSWCEEKDRSHSGCGPMRSVPHRGSGWVLRSDFDDWKVPVGPTRYRDVVLTSWDRSLSHDYVVNGQGMTCQTLMIEKVPVGPTRLPHGGTDLMGPRPE